MTDKSNPEPKDKSVESAVCSTDVYFEQGVEAFLRVEAEGKLIELRDMLTAMIERDLVNIVTVTHPYDETRVSNLAGTAASVGHDFMNLIKRGTAPSLLKISYLSNLISYGNEALRRGGTPPQNLPVDYTHGVVVGVLTERLGEEAARAISMWNDPDDIALMAEAEAADEKAASILTGDEKPDPDSPWGQAGLSSKVVH